MANLFLDSLTIQNFRCFQDFKIEKLARVNLIVGRNGVGKTALLEALELYASRFNPSVIQKLLLLHDEIKAINENMKGLDIINMVGHLTYGRKFNDLPIVIGDSHDNLLSILIRKHMAKVDESIRVIQHFVKALIPSTSLQTAPIFLPNIVIKLGSEAERIYLLEEFFNNNDQFEGSKLAGPKWSSIGVKGLNNSEIAAYWDAVTLTELEHEVLKALQIIEPRVVSLAFIGEERQGRKRIPMIKLAGQNERIPLRSLGEGMNRMLGLALKLVNAKESMLLIDELENGLHYSTQPIVWRMIFQLAQQFNIQVFVTTHSIDCIKGFNQALKEHPEVGLLLRLRRRPQTDEVVAIPAKKDKLELFISEQLEVR